MRSHRDCHPKMDDRLMLCHLKNLKSDPACYESWMRNCGHLNDPVNGTMNYLQAWLLLFLKLGESDRY